MLFSILIPTLERRLVEFSALYAALEEQINRHDLRRDAEIVFDRDHGQQSIGKKRNALIERANGTFVAFVDDDDSVSPDYVRLICDAIRQNPNVDCLGIRGIITFRGSHPKELVYSLKYRDIFSRNHTYYRPPAQLNPIRREIALRYRFVDSSYSEDFDWALRLRDDGALQSEICIDPPIYFYRSRRWWPYQFTLDCTEALRHPLGLTFVNRLRNGNRHAS